MTIAPRLLLADDEPTFLEATADLLRQEGFDCTTVFSADEAKAVLAEDRDFDLLITDLEMPGNTDLGLVRYVAELENGMPVIVITGYPTVRSAVACIELPVAAYLTKPVVFPDLLDRVRNSVARLQRYRAMQRMEVRLRDWRSAFQDLSSGNPVRDDTPVDTFMALTLQNVMGSLSDIGELGRSLAVPGTATHACQLMNCPRGAQLQSAVRETVAVLEETKSAFKSKVLADLRRKLELMLQYV